MNESELLPRKKCQEVFLAVEQAARRAGVKDVEIILSSTSDALTRFANNEIHQNVSERATGVSLRVVVDGRTARASTNRLHRDGIQAAVDEAIEELAQPFARLLAAAWGQKGADRHRNRRGGLDAARGRSVDAAGGLIRDLHLSFS